MLLGHGRENKKGFIGKRVRNSVENFIGTGRFHQRVRDAFIQLMKIIRRLIEIIEG
jgi:hypothetical protein